MRLSEKASKIYKLQEMDKEIHHLENKLKNIPIYLDNLHREIEKLSQDYENLKTEIVEKDLELKDLMQKVNKEEKAIKDFEKIFYQTKDRKELEKLRQKIEKHKKLKEEIETRFFEFSEKIDDLKEKRKDLEKELEKKKKEYEGEKKRLGEEKERIRYKLADKIKLREIFSKEIDRDILKVYEKIKQKMGFPVVVKVKIKYCSYCGAKVPEENLLKIKNGEIVQCLNCGRLLAGFVDEMEA